MMMGLWTRRVIYHMTRGSWVNKGFVDKDCLCASLYATRQLLCSRSGKHADEAAAPTLSGFFSVSDGLSSRHERMQWMPATVRKMYALIRLILPSILQTLHTKSNPPHNTTHSDFNPLGNNLRFGHFLGQVQASPISQMSTWTSHCR